VGLPSQPEENESVDTRRYSIFEESDGARHMSSSLEVPVHATSKVGYSGQPMAAMHGRQQRAEQPALGTLREITSPSPNVGADDEASRLPQLLANLPV
jgi:hypothetical protein